MTLYLSFSCLNFAEFIRPSELSRHISCDGIIFLISGQKCNFCLECEASNYVQSSLTASEEVGKVLPNY